MHCCAGSPLLVACRGGQPFAGSVVGGIPVPPGLAGGKSAAAMTAPPSFVSGSRAACESTASSFSWVGSTGASCLGGCAGLFGWVRPGVFRLGEASSFRGGLLRPVDWRPALTTVRSYSNSVSLTVYASLNKRPSSCASRCRKSTSHHPSFAGVPLQAA